MSADGRDQLQSPRPSQPPPSRQHHHHHRSRAEPYCHSAHGTLYFNPRGRSDRHSQHAVPATFPNPLIGPRPRRPHSIHIVSYPAGFIPRDLRQELGGPSSGGGTANGKRGSGRRKNSVGAKRRKDRRRSSQEEPGPRERKASRALQKILCALSGGSRTGTARQHSPTPAPEPLEAAPRVTVQARSRPVSLLSIGRRLSRLGDFPEEQPPTQGCGSMVGQMVRPPLMSSMASPTSATTNYRSSILSHRSAKSAVMSSAVTEIRPSKPVASGGGLSCSIVLAEPNVFLSGFEHDGHARENAHSGTALLRGKLVLNASKNAKLKSVTLKLVGRARTEWPEGIPPMKVDLFEEQSLRTQGLTFFHAMHDGWETEHGNQCVFTPKQEASGSRRPGSPHGLGRLSPSGSNMSVNTLIRSGLGAHGGGRQSTGLTAKELKRLSLQSVQSRSFGKGENPSLPSQAQLKGYKVFVPGTYEYSFELPIDHHQLETTRLQYGSVRWQLETVVERAGAFRPNLHGVREVSIVRVPDQLSLEMSEPISIARQWEDQLHYDIMISGKSFPIGARIPIAFKLTPLAKVQVHKIKIFVTESIEYWTSDRRVTRKDQGRKMLLLEKTAGKPLDTRAYEGSDVRVLRGGELSPDERQRARAAAARRRELEAQRAQAHLAGACMVEPLPEPTENLLGDLDLGLESYWAATEMEMNVQLPTCEMMARDKSKRLNPDCTWKNVNVFHWIKASLYLPTFSRPRASPGHH